MKKSAILLLLLWPQHVSAMTIEQFDRMVAEDQRHYLVFLVKEAQTLLIEQGQPELAKNVERLFREIPSGEQSSIGELQLEKSLAAARGAKVRFSLWHAPTSEVESVFCQALFARSIRPAPAFLTRFGEFVRNRVFFQKALAEGRNP